MKHTLILVLTSVALSTTSAVALGSSQPSESPELLPDPLDNFADITLPDHFLTPELQALDNTPLRPSFVL